MRLRIWVVGLMLMMISTVYAQDAAPTIDYEASATTVIRNATLTAQAAPNQPTATPEQIFLTATVLVRNATLTKEASTGQTAVPITSTPVPNSEASATALVQQATAQASGGNTGNSDAVSNNAGSIAGIIVGVVVALLAAIGGALGLVSNKDENK